MADLLAQTELSSDDKFKLLVTNVPVEMAREKPPVDPSESRNYLVDKNLVGIDWKHTTSSWLNRNSKTRIFTQLININEHSNDDEPDDQITWQSREIKASEIKTGLTGEGYILKTTYYNHANVKYSNVRRVITTVRSFKNNKIEEMNYALIQYMFPDDIEHISPKKRKGKPFVPTAPSVKYVKRYKETFENGTNTSRAQQSNLLQTVGGK